MATHNGRQSGPRKYRPDVNLCGLGASPQRARESAQSPKKKNKRESVRGQAGHRAKDP